jgi:hypothetical protein
VNSILKLAAYIKSQSKNDADCACGFFCVPPEKMIHTHFPKFLEHQFLAKPIEKTAFLALPKAAIQAKPTIRLKIAYSVGTVFAATLLIVLLAANFNEKPDLKEPFSGKITRTAEELTVLNIYRWITVNIAYDPTCKMADGYISPALTYSKRMGVCEDYAALFAYLATVNNLKIDYDFYFAQVGMPGNESIFELAVSSLAAISELSEDYAVLFHASFGGCVKNSVMMGLLSIVAVVKVVFPHEKSLP